MTDAEILQAIHAALPELLENQRLMREQLEELTRGAERQPEPRYADDLVDVDYFARVTGLSRVTILQGKAGTDRVPRASKRPSRWRKGDVDRFARERAAAYASPKVKAVKLLDRKRA